MPVCLPRNQVPSAYTNEIFQKTELYVPYAALERAKALEKNLLESSAPETEP